MEPSPAPAPSDRRPVTAVALSAAAAFVFLLAAVRLMAWADGYEPAIAAATGGAALLLAILTLTLRRSGTKVERPGSGPRGLTAGGFGAALGAGAFALAAALVPAICGERTAARSDGAVTTVRSLGRTLRYPDSARAHADALVADSQSPSLARVLLLGGGRPELVRELLGRGAVEIDVVDPDGTLDEALAPSLTEEDRVAEASPRVRHHRTDPLAFLRAHRGAPYDLAVISPPEPRSIRSGRWYSMELHRELAGRGELAGGQEPGGRLGRLGVLVVSLPDAARSRPELPLARMFDAMQEGYPLKAAAVLPAGPGRPGRLLAARLQEIIAFNPTEAAARCSERLMPGGGKAPKVTPEELQPLLDRNAVRELTTAVNAFRAGPETLRSPRLFLEQRAAGNSGRGWFRSMLGAPIWAFLPVFLAALVGGMLLARRGSTPQAPGRFALGAAAFLTGLVGAGAGLTLLLVYQALRGTLSTELPALTAAAAAGVGLGGAVAARLAGRLRGAPRMSLVATGFVALLALLLAVALANLAAPGSWAGPLVGLGLTAFGFLGGLEFGALATLCPTEDGRTAPGALVGGLGFLGAAAGAALVAAGLLPALGPAVALLMLLGFKLVELAVLAAGAGRSPERESNHGTTAQS